jgi:excisionase family DNA binding protein
MKRRYSLDSLLTVPEVATRMKVKKRTVREWVYLRKIPFTRFERRIYVDAGVVEEMLAANEVPALPARRSPNSKPNGQGGASKESEVEQ